MNIDDIKRPHDDGVGLRALCSQTSNTPWDHLPMALAPIVDVAVEYLGQFSDRAQAQSPFFTSIPAPGRDAAEEYIL